VCTLELTTLSPAHATLSEPSFVPAPMRRGWEPVASVTQTAESKLVVPATRSPALVIESVNWLYSLVPEVTGCRAPLSGSIAQICWIAPCLGTPGKKTSVPSGDHTGWPMASHPLLALRTEPSATETIVMIMSVSVKVTAAMLSPRGAQARNQKTSFEL